MTTRTLAGAALIAIPMLGIIAASSWAITGQHGWRAALTTWAITLTAVGSVVTGAIMLA